MLLQQKVHLSFQEDLSRPHMIRIETRPGVQQCQAQGQVFCP